MSESNTAPAAPDSGGNTNPNLTVMPDPASAGSSPGALNKQQQAELTKAREICGVAQQPEYAPALELRGIAAAFVTALLADITAAEQKAQLAVASTSASRDAARGEQAAAQTLVDSLRTIQSAARQKHLPERPELLGNYYVGEDIAQSGPLLQAHSQNIIHQADQERPPGVDTTVIARVQSERGAVIAANATQNAELSKGKQGRAERDALVKSIIARRKKIQYAADAQWPPKRPASAQARNDFKLPAKRPYSY